MLLWARRRRQQILLFLILGTALVAIFLSVGPTGSAHDAASGLKVIDDFPVPVPAQRRRAVGVESVPFTSEELRYIKFGEGDAAVAEDDPRYQSYIRTYITRPTKGVPRTLKDQSGRKHFSQAHQSEFVDKRLQQRRDGFYVECGAVDGETLSNTLFFELERNWTGLLVEANPAYHRTLLGKNRQAYVLGGCLSPTRRPGQLTFKPAGVFGGIGENMEKSHADFVGKRPGGKATVTVQCFPLTDILAALGVTHVDYLSLDVEGPELEILKTIDLTRLRVDVLTIEYRVITSVPRVKVDFEATEKKLNDLRALFNSTGLYREVARLNVLDVVFERTDLRTA